MKIAVSFEVRLCGLEQLLLLLCQHIAQMSQLLFEVFLVFASLLPPLAPLLLCLISIGQQVSCCLVKLGLIISEKPSDLLDSLARGLHFVVFVEAVDGTLWTDGAGTGEAEVGELFLRVIWTGVLQLVSLLGIGSEGRL